MKELTIGKLAGAAGVGVETIRFYERKGLIKRPPKREAGFRRYPLEDVARVRFIKRAQELGFTLREVKEVLSLQSGRRFTGSEVKRRAERKIEEISRKMADLARMKDSLEKLGRACGEGEQAVRECRIFDCFGDDCNERRKP